MTPPLPLDQIRFGWRSHLSALWWLGLLYRKPELFLWALMDLGSWQAVAGGVKLHFHVIPWMFVVSIVSRLFLHAVLGFQSRERLLLAIDEFDAPSAVDPRGRRITHRDLAVRSAGQSRCR